MIINCFIYANYNLIAVMFHQRRETILAQKEKKQKQKLNKNHTQHLQVKT